MLAGLLIRRENEKEITTYSRPCPTGTAAVPTLWPIGKSQCLAPRPARESEKIQSRKSQNPENEKPGGALIGNRARSGQKGKSGLGKMTENSEI